MPEVSTCGCFMVKQPVCFILWNLLRASYSQVPRAKGVPGSSTRKICNRNLFKVSKCCEYNSRLFYHNGLYRNSVSALLWPLSGRRRWSDTWEDSATAERSAKPAWVMTMDLHSKTIPWLYFQVSSYPQLQKRIPHPFCCKAQASE